MADPSIRAGSVSSVLNPFPPEKVMHNQAHLPPFVLQQDRLYTEKLGVPAGSISGRRDVVEHYLTGLHWVLEYYYRGVASWDWYYQHHYAPMASDLVRLDDITGQICC